MTTSARRSQASYCWKVADPWPGSADLAARLRSAPLVAQLLHNRGIETPEAARAYLAPKLTDLHDPQQLAGTAEAARRITRAAQAGERIVLYGDYDVDGMTGSAILYRCLTLLDAQVDFYIPHRIEEGYGLNLEAVETLARDGAKLLVTVDCGIGAAACVERAGQLGLDVIITDHHALGSDLPAAAGIVHPHLGDYPNRDLCGAGVALKLAWQICRDASGSPKVTAALREFLLDATCLAALGTIADVVPLRGENRVLAAYGLRGLPQTRHPGIRALIAAAGLDGKRVGEYDVGFQLAPRLNAAGRMGHAREAAELLVFPERCDCTAVAAALTRQNEERRRVEREIADQATEMVLARRLDADGSRVIVLAAEGWHAGVIGIVASRLVERFSRPTVLISLDGEIGQGSGRSVEGFHLAEALASCGEHLVSHGGHAMAAGLKIDAARVDSFAAAMAEHAAMRLTDDMLVRRLAIDAEARLVELSAPVVQQIRSMAPFGAGNAPVVLAVRKARLAIPAKRIGQTGNTLSLLLAQGDARMRCVGFGMGPLADRLAGVAEVDVAAEPVINNFNGRQSVELMLKDVRWD